jgi:hypothetical protein
MLYTTQSNWPDDKVFRSSARSGEVGRWERRDTGRSDTSSGIEILRNDTLLLPKFLNLDIPLVEPATAEYEALVPSFPRHPFVLFVH